MSDNNNRKQKRSVSKQELINMAFSNKKQLNEISKILTKCLVVNTILMNRFNITEEDINREYANMLTSQTPIINRDPKPIEESSVQPEHKPSDEDNSGGSESGVSRGASDDSDQASSGTEVQPPVRTEDDGSSTTTNAG